MSERAPYSRVYWTVIDDSKFADIYDDDHALAAWLRLLITADMAWPASAQIPITVRKAALDKLVSAGLVDLGTGWRFRIHGLDSERGDRKAAATRARLNGGPTGTQTPPNRDPDVAVIPGRRRDETSKAETSNAREVPDGRKDLEAWMQVRGFYPPTPRQRAFLDGYVRTFDVTGPERAERLILSHPDDPIAALKKDLDAFRAERRDAAVASEVPKVVPRRKASGLTGVNAELARMFNGQYAAEEKKP